VDGATLAPILGCLLLVVIASTRGWPGRRAIGVLGVFVASTVLTAAAMGAFIRSRRLLPKTLASELVNYGLLQLANATEKNVLVLDGGSYPARGIDERVLAKELAARGYSVRVVHLGLSAGNHLERYTMYEDLLSRVPAIAPGRRTIFLAEAHIGYDMSPFAQLERNRDTARTYHYVTPTNAWYGLRSVFFGGGDRIAGRDLAWTVARHAMINGFQVGTASYLFPDTEVRPHSGHIFGTHVVGFRFAGLAEPLKIAQESPDQVVIPRWLWDVRERRLRALWDGRVSAWAYYGVPSATPIPTQFIRKFCTVTKEPCIAPDVALLRSLDHAEDWYDIGHMSSRGAALYSAWLAARIDQAGLLRK